MDEDLNPFCFKRGFVYISNRVMLHMKFAIWGFAFIDRLVILSEIAVAVSSDGSKRRDALFWGADIPCM